EARGPRALRFRIDDRESRAHERGDCSGNLRGARRLVALERPLEHSRLVGLVRTLRREDDLLLFELARERALEDAVHVLDERRARAPGMLEDLVRRAARDERGERVPHELGIAASETVDRLLDVAYEDDPTRERRELHEDRELHRVGVLELV